MRKNETCTHIISFQTFPSCLSQCSTILFRNYWSCHSKWVKVAIMDSVSVVPLSLSLWTSKRQSFLRLMPVFPSAPKHGNYTSFYVPLVQACDSNSEPISAGVLFRITAWQRGVTMYSMLSWKTCSEITCIHVPSFIYVMEWYLSQWILSPWVFSSFDILIKY